MSDDARRLVLDFPLRPEFLAQVVLPRDLTAEEARRLCRFIEAVAPIEGERLPELLPWS